MSQADIIKWDQKYRLAEGVKSPAPEAELLAFRALLPSTGSALDLACGMGKNSLYLAQQGMQVTALDGSIEALRALEKSAFVLGVATHIKTQQADLDDFTLPEAAFDLIVVVRYFNHALLGDIARALKPGGMLLYKTFNRKILETRPGFNPAYTIETPALIVSFPELDVAADNQADPGSEYAFIIGRKRI